MSGALDHVRVLDLSRVAAGPYCTRLLAGLGADVVKVEPAGGDPARAIRSSARGSGERERSALFLFLNQGKRSVALDLDRPGDRASLDALLRRADVLVESFACTEVEQLRLGYERLAAAHPALVVTSIRDFGCHGPYQGYIGAEIVANAMGGLMALTGEPAREPLNLPGWQASYLAGTAAAIGTLLALRERRHTGRGQHVAASLLEAVASSLEGALGAAAAGEPPRQRRGHRQRADYPLMLLPCRDGYVVLTVANDADWEALTYLIGDERLAEQRFSSSAGREQHADELEAILRQWLSRLDRQEFFAATQEWRFPCTMVIEPEEVFRDAQHEARQFFVTVDHPIAGPLRYPGPPFRMPASPWRSARAPLLGEHTAELPRLWPSSRFTVATKPRSLDAPLDGIRVLDLTAMWAGPYCTRILADAGAEVIKIELASRPDGTRRSRAQVEATGDEAPFFGELNRNKLGVTLDLRTQRDLSRFRELVKISDVVVENFSPRVMSNLGIDYGALSALRSDLVMLSMPAFGSDGPLRDAVAFGGGIEAMSGFAALAGYRDGPPELAGVAFGDPVAGLHGALAVLAALEHRERTGEGQHAELAQREALTQFMGEMVAGLDLGELPVRLGNRHGHMAPHGCYRSAGEDRWVALAVGDDQQWQRLCALIDAKLARDPRFATLAARQANHDALDAIITDWTRRHEHRVAARLLQGAGIPAGAVLDARELLVDEQLARNDFFVRAGGQMQIGSVCHLSAHLGRAITPAPRVGEHDKWLDRMLTGGADKDLTRPA